MMTSRIMVCQDARTHSKYSDTFFFIVHVITPIRVIRVNKSILSTDVSKTATVLSTSFRKSFFFFFFFFFFFYLALYTGAVN